MNKALIDTDIISYYLKGDPNVVQNVKNYLDYYSTIQISLITYYEITSGLTAKNATKQLFDFEEFISKNDIVPITIRSAKISAELYSILRQNGNIIDDIDLLIAGIALENKMILVTNNERHFSRITELKIENWKKKLS